MPLLIDGHNLIGSGMIPGISLSDRDDEVQLVRLLRRYRSRVRSNITVVFDSGIPGGRSRELSGGGVNAVFAFGHRQRADDIIAAHVRRAANPGELSVVTSDSRLAQEAQSHGAHVIPSTDFARRLLEPLPATRCLREEPPLAEGEIEEWLAFFDADAEG